MNKTSALGPDGFGPSFYSAAWADVKLQVMALVSAYHYGQLELCRINRSYMVSWVRVGGVVMDHGPSGIFTAQQDL